MSVFLLRDFLHSDVLQERKYRTECTTFLYMDPQTFACDDADRRH
jgi:hypothetical protein